MRRFWIFFLAGTVAFMASIVLPEAICASSRVQTSVRVIHASQDPHHIDASIRDLAAELESVFRYTAYRLVQSRAMTLEFNQKGSVGLPGDRTLMVNPARITGGRIQYQISILKAGEQIFQTQVLLRDGGSITIGGPRYGNGYLLFNISGQVR